MNWHDETRAEFGVTPFDLPTFVITGSGLRLVALIACAIPAWRAARIDAIGALKPR